MANLNVPPISVGKLIDQLSSYYERVILNHVDLKQVRAVFLWGKPGVGKSESVGQIAERIRKSTKRNVEVRELRLSNYLLWQCAYSELYFCDTYWPDFREEEFHKAIYEFQRRERRFGKTSEQITTEQQ